MKIICFGDSLTFGNVGYSYIYFLRKKSHHQYINKGKNGDTVTGLYKRLVKTVGNLKNESEMYIIGIGTNDILLPYLKSVSLFWFLQMSLRCKIKKCIEDDDYFCQKYNDILTLLSKNNKQAVIFGMPFINLKHFPLEQLIRRNKIIEELAEKYHYPYIDIYRLQKEKIAADYRIYTWKYRFLIRTTDAVIMTLFPFTKDCFARLRGLTTSVDGAHFNSESAKILAMEIEKYEKG
jgi:lipase/acylhydrolase, GDSL family